MGPCTKQVTALIVTTPCQPGPDPYAELDYRADADELSDEKKPARVRMHPRRALSGPPRR